MSDISVGQICVYYGTMKGYHGYECRVTDVRVTDLAGYYGGLRTVYDIEFIDGPVGRKRNTLRRSYLEPLKTEISWEV